MTKVLLWGLLLLLIFRAIGRVLSGIVDGASLPRDDGGDRRGSRPPAAPAKGELMVRDPVCGTYVVPSRALSARTQDGPVYFCSEKCRQAHTAR